MFSLGGTADYSLEIAHNKKYFVKNNDNKLFVKKNRVEKSEDMEGTAKVSGRVSSLGRDPSGLLHSPPRPVANWQRGTSACVSLRVNT